MVAAAVACAGGVVAFLATASVLATALAGAAMGGVAWWVQVRRYLRRRSLVGQPFPEPWRAVLERRVPFYVRLEGDARQRFEQDVRIFVTEQRIYGPRGAEVDDAVKVLVAASAAILTHGIPTWEWPGLRDIVVYRTAFDDDYAVAGNNDILGMVHAQGPIIFSGKDLRHGFARPRDGLNVGLHELAHVMDFASGNANGVPAGIDFVGSAPWIQVVAERLQQIREGSDSQVLRDYAGENEAELFAVAVEVFFERPRALKKRDPKLYEMLKGFFGQDPAASR